MMKNIYPKFRTAVYRYNVKTKGMVIVFIMKLILAKMTRHQRADINQRRIREVKKTLNLHHMMKKDTYQHQAVDVLKKFLHQTQINIYAKHVFGKMIEYSKRVGYLYHKHLESLVVRNETMREIFRQQANLL